MRERMRIPATGRAHEDILGDVRSFTRGDVDYAGGRTWSLVYWPGDAHGDLVRRAHDLLLSGNALNPAAFKSLKRMEGEVVQMSLDLMHGPPGAVGTMSSGGTESLMCAVLAARERARARRPWIWRPNAVAPDTIHPAIDKATHAFGIQLRRVSVDADGRASVPSLRRAVDRNTVLILASAPSYPWGVVDPIPEIAAVAARRGVPMHVDACFGGFLLPWLERIGVSTPTWDFQIEGVTSISADLHKYGFAAKGASVILYRDISYLRHQFFVSTQWKGGIYASPTLAGTRPGGPIAAAWASLQGMGEAGFLDRARGAWEAAQRLRAGIAEIPGLRVLGVPHATIVAYASSDAELDLFAVADHLEGLGWPVDRQQGPPSVHCSVNACNAPVVEQYLADLAASVAHAWAHPELASKGNAAIYGLLNAVPLRAVTDRAVRDVLAQMYAPGATAADLGGGPVIERAARVARRLQRLGARVGGRG